MLHIVSSAHDSLAPSPAKAALVTVVIGEAYEKAWSRICAGSWLAYAERFGLDVVVLNDRIDRTDTARSPAWQKLLILNLPWAKRYERIVWLDSDIVIAPHAPDILACAGPVEKISLCDNSARLSPVEGHVLLERLAAKPLPPQDYATAWRNEQRGFYEVNGVPAHDRQFNTGVMVLSPAHHNDLLLRIYPSPQRTALYEQPYLSHILLNEGLAYPISPRFNWGVSEALHLYVVGHAGDYDEVFVGRFVHLLVRAELRNAYFLHFYGAMFLLKQYAETAAQAPRAA